jgi:hypothetical protein
LINNYTQGDIVRVTCTFSFDVPDETFFEFKNTMSGKKTIVQIENTVDGLQINRDADTKKCYVDIDTFNRVGNFSYFFYTRGSFKAGAKGSFNVK